MPNVHMFAGYLTLTVGFLTGIYLLTQPSPPRWAKMATGLFDLTALLGLFAYFSLGAGDRPSLLHPLLAVLAAAGVHWAVARRGHVPGLGFILAVLLIFLSRPA